MMFRILFIAVAIVFSISISSSVLLGQQEKSDDVKLLLPSNTLIFLDAPNLRHLFEGISGTEFGQLINQTPFGTILKEALREENDEEVAPELLDEIARMVQGRMTLAIFPDKKNGIGFVSEIGLVADHPFVVRLKQSLLVAGQRYGFSATKDSDSTWKHHSGYVLQLSQKRLIVANSIEHVISWSKGLPTGFDSDSKRSFEENRKWRRVSKNLKIDGAAIHGFIDSGRIINMYAANQPDTKKLRSLLGDTGMLDALAAGFAFRINEQDTDLLLDAFLLCAVPRQGVWSALSLEPLDDLKVPHCPANVGYALVGKSNLKEMIQALEKLEAHAQSEFGMTKEAFHATVSQYAPPLYFPLFLRDKVADLFTGEFFLFGEASPTGGWWNNGLSVGVSLQENMEKVVEKLTLGSADEELLVKKTDGSYTWWVESDESRRHNAELIKQMAAETQNANLSIEQLGRVGFICEERRFIRFASEPMLIESMRVTQELETGINDNPNFHEVQKRLLKLERPNPSLAFFVAGSEILKWPMYELVGPGKGSRDQYWQSELEEVNQPDNLPNKLKKAWLDQTKEWKSVEKMSAQLGCVGGGVWDLEAGFSLKVFMLKKLQTKESDMSKK